jgi:hypothetical protein
LLWVCSMDVPGKLDVSAFSPATALKSVLFPQLGWPMKTTSGYLFFFANYLYYNPLGNSPAQGHRRI